MQSGDINNIYHVSESFISSCPKKTPQVYLKCLPVSFYVATYLSYHSIYFTTRGDPEKCIFPGAILEGLGLFSVCFSF